MEEKIHITRKKESDEVRLKRLKENMSKGLKPKIPTQKERWEMYQRRCKGESKSEEWRHKREDIHLAGNSKKIDVLYF